MSKAKKYKVLWAAVILFIGLNIWLLYGKAMLQQKVDSLQVKTIQKGGAITSLFQPIQFTPASSVKGFTKSIELVALFSDSGCPHCAQAEVKYLNRWRKRFPHTLQVYYAGISKGYLENFGAKFSFQKIKSANKLFSVTLPLINPLVILVDQKGNVQAIHTNDTSRPGSDQRRAAFYKRMHSLFQSVYGTQ